MKGFCKNCNMAKYVQNDVLPSFENALEIADPVLSPAPTINATFLLEDVDIDIDTG
jgi:hypothetical protein